MATVNWEPALSMKRRHEAELNGFFLRVMGAAKGSGQLSKWTVGRTPHLLHIGEAKSTIRAKKLAEKFVTSGRAEKAWKKKTSSN